MTDVSNQARTGFHRILDNRLDEIPKLAEEFEHWSAGAGIPGAAVRAVNLMLDELITNVVMYGYPAQQRGEIDLNVQLAPGRLEVLLTDFGRAHDPLQAREPDLDSDIAARPIGGLGVHFVRRLADEVTYGRMCVGGRDANRVRIVKRFEAGRES